jgi:uncharacterized phage-associated protein
MGALDFRKYHYFDYEKTIQLLAYIQKKANTTDKLALIKLLFFADRMHLRRYSSLISHDVYYALKNGPAASKTLNILNHSNYLESDVFKTKAKLLAKIQLINQSERIIKETATTCLTEEEKKVVDTIVDIFKDFQVNALIDITHDYPEWRRYEYLLNSGLTDGELVQMDDFFRNPYIPNSPALKKYFQGVDPLYEDEDFLEEMKEFYYEGESLRNAYR